MIQEAAVRAVKHAMESTALPGVLSMVPGLILSYSVHVLQPYTCIALDAPTAEALLHIASSLNTA